MKSSSRNKKIPDVLLVEDNEADAELTRLAFEAMKIPVQLQHVLDGTECMAFLRRQGAYAEAPRPDLVLLDINMPRMNGFEVLEQIQSDRKLRGLRVVVLTSSGSEQDQLRMQRLKCEAYVVKPVEFRDFVETLGAVMGLLFPPDGPAPVASAAPER